MKNYKVEGYNSLERTPNNAVINSDITEYNKYLKNREKLKNRENEIEIMKEEILFLKNQLKELMNK